MRLSRVLTSTLPLGILAFLLILCGPTVLSAAEADRVSYSEEIRPILARRCYACHGPTVQEAGLALHSREAATTETPSGTLAIVPGKPDESELVFRIEQEDAILRMPPEEHKPLTDEEVATIRQWITEGAEFNQHWAFQPIPDVKPPHGAAENPVDRFIDARLEKAGLEKAPRADRPTLIRRLYYDLVGLPPTPQEVRDFVNDEDPQAYEKLVDELLASPHYGERWARHWLDVVRYAESNSFERDNAKSNAWKYRDYVIRSFNEDKPYDQFLKEQLAGDELENVTRESLIASGFYRLGIWDDEPADPLQARYDELDSILTTISQGMLGLTVNCARCHDHKIDPMPQDDYYRLLAFIDELTPYAERGNPDIYSQIDVTSDQLKEKYAELEQQLADLRKRKYDLEQTGVVKMSAEDQRATETRRREKVLKDKLKDYLDDEAWAKYQGLKAEERDLEQALRDLPAREMVMGVKTVRLDREPTRVMQRGNPHSPGDVVEPGFPELFGDPDPVIPEEPPQPGRSGKRKALAEWVASEDNRLTARVMVNRIWQHHFGRGIVQSPNNFGLLGVPPTHPDLLNWLAKDFMEGGWTMKRMHRLIVTSDAYKRSSQSVSESLAQDPNNELFWRFDLRRLSAEEIRDSVLAVSGVLNEDVYGPSFFPKLSEEVLATQSKPGNGWGNSSPRERNRRSIYIFIKRSLIPPELATFDFPETDTTCEARFTTIQPAQALAMLNGQFLNEEADHFAKRLREEAGDDVRAQVERGLSLVTSESADPVEVEAGLELISDLKTEHNLSEDEALTFFCLYALNLNEFMFVD